MRATPGGGRGATSGLSSMTSVDSPNAARPPDATPTPSPMCSECRASMQDAVASLARHVRPPQSRTSAGTTQRGATGVPPVKEEGVMFYTQELHWRGL